jgi:hypothetical protein
MTLVTRFNEISLHDFVQGMTNEMIKAGQRGVETKSSGAGWQLDGKYYSRHVRLDISNKSDEAGSDRAIVIFISNDGGPDETGTIYPEKLHHSYFDAAKFGARLGFFADTQPKLASTRFNLVVPPNIHGMYVVDTIASILQAVHGSMR